MYVIIQNQRINKKLNHQQLTLNSPDLLKLIANSARSPNRFSPNMIVYDWHEFLSGSNSLFLRDWSLMCSF